MSGMPDLKLIAAAKQIAAVAFDVDGVFTDNRVCDEMPQLKFRSYYDGQGVSLLRAIGIRVALVSNEKGDWLQKLVDKWNSLLSSKSENNPTGWEHVRLFTSRSGLRKVEAIEEWLKEIAVPWEKCAAMGDDLVDAPLLLKAGLIAVPATADETIKEICLKNNGFVSTRLGGNGAVRDFANFILKVRGINPLGLPPN